MSVFDLRAYDRQLKTKLNFEGRVNNNACEQSCTTLCQLYMSTLSCLMRFQIIMLPHRGPRQGSTPVVVIAGTDDFLRVLFVAAR